MPDSSAVPSDWKLTDEEVTGYLADVQSRFDKLSQEPSTDLEQAEGQLHRVKRLQLMLKNVSKQLSDAKSRADENVPEDDLAKSTIQSTYGGHVSTINTLGETLMQCETLSNNDVTRLGGEVPDWNRELEPLVQRHATDGSSE